MEKQNAEGAEEAVVVGLAGEAGGTVEGDEALFEADDGDHAAQEAVGLLELHDFEDDSPGHEPEVAGIGRDLHVGDFVDHLVAAAGDELLDPRFAGAGAALRQDDVVALPPLFDHLMDELGRVLQIDVHDDDGVAARIVHAGERGHRLAEAAGELEEFDPVVLGALGEDNVLGAIRRRIHRKDDFVVLGDLAQDRPNPAKELGDIFLFAEDGDNDAQEHGIWLTANGH